MSRQTRRSTTVADAADVSQMDPWKDDRCRDFLALNTIQRLRSYHVETLLPVEPVNSVRARNLVMLPKPEPLEKTCETDAGCAIDTARILFFGPMSFLSLTSQGRTTASPHGAGEGVGHSGGHVSLCPSNDIAAKANTGGSPMHPPTDPNAKSSDIAHIIDAGATPLRLNPNGGKDTVHTPSPCPRRQPDANSDMGHHEVNIVNVIADNNDHSDEGDIDRATRSGGGGGVAMDFSGTPAVETQRFSCAIVEALTAYYQSLLSRGVVLDRFNAKDLAFAWWVVGRNMDVSALSRHTGSMRRDALLILVRHFYYELLTEQRLKKELTVKEVSAEENVRAEAENLDSGIKNSNTNRGSSSSSSNADNDDINESTQKGLRDGEEGTSVKHTTTAKMPGNNNNNNNNRNSSSSSISARKRTRSRLDPTRTSTSTASHRSRRQPMEKQLQQQEQQQQQQDTDVGASDSVKPPAVTVKDEIKGKPDKDNAQQPEEWLPEGSNAALRPAAPEKYLRPPRGANIDEVWRPLRATRRRPPTPEDSIDFATVTAIAAEAATAKAPVDPLAVVVERIQRRMAQDSVYAALATAFPSVRRRAGMHPALLRLLRYVRRAANETDDTAPHIASESPIDVKREAGDVEEEVGRNGEGIALAAMEEEDAERGREGSVCEEEKKEEQDQQLQKHQQQGNPEQRVDWEGYIQHVAVQMAEAKSRRHSNDRGNAVKSSESAEGNDSNTDEDDDEADEGEEDEEVNRDEESDDDDCTAPVVRPPCPFSALTYAQQCLLTWEASDILDPRCSVAAVRRKKRERDRRNKRRLRQRQQQQQHMSPEEVASECVRAHRPRRNVYDYWKHL